MNKITNNWKDQSRAIKAVIIACAFLFVCVCGALYFYYDAHSKQQKIKAAQELKKKQEQTNKKRIYDFYADAVNGISVDKFLSLIYEINISRVSFDKLGFLESEYQCDVQSCSFNYKLKDNSLFNVQDKILYGKNYQPVISENSLSYNVSPLELNKNQLKYKFDNKIKIDAPLCDDVVNYIYSYNSLFSKERINRKIKLTSLPTNSVESQESSLPNYEYNLGLKVGKISLQYNDNPLFIKLLLNNNPYKDYILINKLNKNSKSNNSILLDGKFICKK